MMMMLLMMIVISIAVGAAAAAAVVRSVWPVLGAAAIRMRFLPVGATIAGSRRCGAAAVVRHGCAAAN